MTDNNELYKAKQKLTPVTREVLADLDTPVTAYIKLANEPYTYLFESVTGGERWGRYSIIGLRCSTVLIVRSKQIEIQKDGVVTETYKVDDPIDFIRQFKRRYSVQDLPKALRFVGGLVGYFSYDMVRYVESKLELSIPRDELNTPDIILMVSEDLVVFDNLTGYITFITYADPSKDENIARAEDILEKRVNKLLTSPCVVPHMKTTTDKVQYKFETSDFIFGLEQKEYEEAVDTIKQYILSGDVMQVVLSQRMSIEFKTSPINFYRALRCSDPSPYMYYLNMGEFYIVGSSPEILSRLEDRKVTVRPMAGTRKRGDTELEDKALEDELRHDTKEKAEHLMLLDLGRNDVGHIAQTGTVEVTEQMGVERYSQVMHMVSNVCGILEDGLDALDVLRSTLPAGTLSGAPKVRAMSIIDELEPVKRGVYGGAIGHLGWDDNMDLAIAIRTAVIKEQRLYIQTGAGVVADSIPKREWEECMNKGKALLKAVAMTRAEEVVGAPQES